MAGAIPKVMPNAIPNIISNVHSKSLAYIPISLPFANRKSSNLARKSALRLVDCAQQLRRSYLFVHQMRVHGL